MALADLVDVGLAVGAGHVEVDQGQVEVVGGSGKQFVDAHRQDEFDAGLQLRQLGFDRLDDEPVVVGDQYFHDVFSPYPSVRSTADAEDTGESPAQQGRRPHQRHRPQAVWRPLQAL